MYKKDEKAVDTGIRVVNVEREQESEEDKAKR